MYDFNPLSALGWGGVVSQNCEGLDCVEGCSKFY